MFAVLGFLRSLLFLLKLLEALFRSASRSLILVEFFYSSSILISRSVSDLFPFWLVMFITGLHFSWLVEEETICLYRMMPSIGFLEHRL